MTGSSRSGRRPLRLLLFALSVLVLATACAATTNAQPVPIKQPLPERESLAYNLLDDKGARIGTASVSIARDGDGLVFQQRYADLQQHTDQRSVTVDAATLAPRQARREIHAVNLNSTVAITYAPDSVSSVASDGREHRHEAKVATGTYDDQEVFFLMRALDFSPGYSAQFADVIVANDGTISRASATATVQKQTTVQLSGKSFTAWEVQLTAAGATSTAWYEAAPTRRLLRYTTSRQTSIKLVNP